MNIRQAKRQTPPSLALFLSIVLLLTTGMPALAFTVTSQVLSGSQSVAAGDYFTVVLKKNGKVAAWGDNTSGQLNVPHDLGPVQAVAAGSKHTVALLADETVRSWGDNTSHQTDVPADLGKVKAIAASRGPVAGGIEGRGHTVALQEDGTVRAWGDDSKGQISVPADLGKAKAIAAGDLFTVAVKEDGTVAVWGDDTFGLKSTIPVGLSGVTAVAAGRSHILALKKMAPLWPGATTARDRSLSPLTSPASPRLPPAGHFRWP